jgi:hypothetical protein
MASYPIRAKWFGWTGGGAAVADPPGTIVGVETAPGSGWFSLAGITLPGQPILAAGDATHLTEKAQGQLQGVGASTPSVRWQDGTYDTSNFAATPGLYQATVHFGPDVNEDPFMDPATPADFPITVRIP